jgi:hypothetical protein
MFLVAFFAATLGDNCHLISKVIDQAAHIFGVGFKLCASGIYARFDYRHARIPFY